MKAIITLELPEDITTEDEAQFWVGENIPLDDDYTVEIEGDES